MQEKLTQKQIDFVCSLHNPIAFKESVFPVNLKAPHTWNEDDVELYRIRNYQFGWQPFNWCLCEDYSLKKEANLRKKILAGTCWNLGARDIGKSWDFLQADTPIDIALYPGLESCLISATSGFLKKVTRPIVDIYRNHPFFKMFHQKGKSQGIIAGEDLEIKSHPGHTWYGRNEKVSSPEPGTKVHGLHYTINKYEEFSYATEDGEEKRVDSGTSIGEIERFSGIPDVRIGSPLGKIFHDDENKGFICRLPQFVRRDWSHEQKQKRVDKYHGESSLAYKLNVAGEIIEGAKGYWDIQRIKAKCLDKKRKIKNFDIGKKKFPTFKNYLVIDRLPAEQIYVCADIGAGARPTEIIVIFYNGRKYKLVYNITLNKLTSQEQADVFAHIYQKLGGAFVGIDATTDYGIVERLKKDYPFINPKHIFGIDLRKNIDYDFEKDEKTGRILFDTKAEPITRKMVAIDFAMQQMEILFYEGQMSIPLDNKFFKEFSDFIVLQSGFRRKYDTSSTDDYHQSFQIFAIVRWFNEWKTIRNQNNQQDDGCLGIF